MTIDLAELQAALEHDPAAAEAICDVLFRAAGTGTHRRAIRDHVPDVGTMVG